MRVLFYYAGRDWSGGARAFAAAASGMLSRGYQVTYVCRAESVIERRIAASGYEVVAVPISGPWINDSLRLREILLEHFVEVVFVQSSREQLVASLAIRLAERGAVVRRVPATARLAYSSAAKVADRLAATGFLFTSATEFPSSLPSDALEPVNADLGVALDALDAVRPVARATLRGAAGGRLLACIYDRTARRRVAVVLRAVALLAPRHPDLRLALVGPGSDHDDLHMHAAALGITEIVAHLGEQEDQQSILRAAELAWVVADHDNAAFGFLDCQGLRVPVVAERTPLSQRYLADGITGELIAQPDPAVMAARLAQLLAHEERRSAMGSAGRTRVAREFTERMMVDGFERATQIARDRSRWRA
jgi:hypothetical protein